MTRNVWMTLPAVAAGLTLLTTGCASKKYVRGTVAPVEERVGQVETRTDQNEARIGEVDTKVSRVDEQVQTAQSDASEAQEMARRAQGSADDAAGMAAEAKTFAGAGIDRLEQTMVDMTRYQPVDQTAVLFGFDSDTLDDESINKLNTVMSSVEGRERYVFEIRGFSDQTGPENYNLQLSERRANAVVRHLTSNGVPLRAIHRIGLGENTQMADNSIDARKQARRVEVSVFVPVAEGGGTVLSQQ